MEVTDLSFCHKVSVVVLNWNGKQYLERCLTSLSTQTYPNYEIILVDNGSTDGSVEFVQRHFPHVRIIQNDSNVGFAAGNNIGIRASDNEYVATLNNDTQVDPRWLEELVRGMESDPTVGMCASKMLRWEQPWIIDSAGVSLDVLGLAWDRHSGELDDELDNEPFEVFSACAGAALYRRAMLDQVGLFDEDFFIYLEDVDLAWRAQLQGWRCLYVPMAVVYHIHSGTVGEGTPFKNRLLGRNKIWLLCKNYPFPQILWYAPLILAYDLMSVGYAIATGRGRGAIQGRIEALSKIPRMLAKRRRIVRRISSRTMMAKLHPLENPLAILRRYAYIRITRGRQGRITRGAPRGD
jgi:hypothetical protein